LASLVVALLLGLGVVVAGCGDDGASAKRPRRPNGATELNVGTTVAPITSIAANIGRETG